MKYFFYTVLFIFMVNHLTAQPENLVFSVQKNVPYTPLNNPTIITTVGWDDFDADIPLGFTWSCLGDTTSTLFIRENDENYGADLQMKTTQTNTVFNIIGWLVDIEDRNNNNSNQFSTIGYQTNTVNGKKITKVEYKNVGIFDGISPDDSAHVQTWFYEENHALEYRFGKASRANITTVMNDSNYYGFKGPIFSLIKNFNPTSVDFDWMYYVSDESLQKVDSIDSPTLISNPSTVGVDSFPTENTLYRWAPAINSGFHSVYLNEAIQVFPTLTHQDLTILIKNEEEYAVQLSDVQGRKILQQVISGSKLTLNIASLPSGRYYLSVFNSQGNWTYPIQKQ